MDIDKIKDIASKSPVPNFVPKKTKININDSKSDAVIESVSIFGLLILILIIE